jgi:hypothetical protein
VAVWEFGHFGFSICHLLTDPEEDDTPTNTPPTSNENAQNNTTNGLVQKALERLENETILLVDDPTTRDFFKTIDELMECQAEHQKKAFEMLKNREKEMAEKSEFLWRMCKSMYLMAVTIGQEGDNAKKQKLIFQAVDYGLKSIQIDETCSEGHKWYAIVIGSRGEYLGIKEKILDGFEFKKHIDRASELSPQDHTIKHLLGRYVHNVMNYSEAPARLVLLCDNLLNTTKDITTRPP